MKTIFELVTVSEDDHRWLATSDLDGLRALLASPNAWVGANVTVAKASVEMSPQYVIQLVTDSRFPSTSRNAFDIVGSGSIVDGKYVTSMITVRFEPTSMVRLLLREFARADRRSFGRTDFPSTAWDIVRASFSSKLEVQLLYRQGASAQVGAVYPHFEMGSDQVAVANFLIAAACCPEGLGPWLNEQAVTERYFWTSSSTKTPITRLDGTKDNFRSDDGPITITIRGELQTAGACKEGYHLTVCNSDAGTYSGDPTATDTDIDIDDVIVKPYCVPNATVAEARAMTNGSQDLVNPVLLRATRVADCGCGNQS